MRRENWKKNEKANKYDLKVGDRVFSLIKGLYQGITKDGNTDSALFESYPPWHSTLKSHFIGNVYQSRAKDIRKSSITWSVPADSSINKSRAVIGAEFSDTEQSPSPDESSDSEILVDMSDINDSSYLAQRPADNNNQEQNNKR